MNFLHLRRLPLLPFAALLLGTVTSHAAPTPSVQGLELGIWNIISDNDLNPNQAVTDFGNVNVGATKDRRYRLRNIGDGFFNWEGASSSDGQFVILNGSGGTQAFPIPIAGNTDREFIIRFTPTTPGTVSPTITLETNLTSLNAEYTFAITGTGQAPDALISGRQGGGGGYTGINDGDTTPRLVDGTDFGFIPVGSSVTRDFELTNTGNLTLDPGSAFFVGGSSSQFSLNGLTFGNLAPGASRTFSITFMPTSVGVKTTTFQFVSDDPDENPYDFTVTGEGLVFPEIVVEGRRTGGVGQTLSNIDDGSVAVFASNGTLLPTTNWGEVGTSLFRISNTGGAPLTLSAPVISGPDAAFFTLSGFSTASIAPGGSREFSLFFAPTSLGTKTAMISFGNNDSNENPFNFALAGDATGGPDIKISGILEFTDIPQLESEIADNDLNPDQFVVNFGTADIDPTSACPGPGGRNRFFVIRNTGSGDLILTAATSSNPEFTFGIGSGLAPEDLPRIVEEPRDLVLFCFLPTSIGERTSIITIESNDPDDENVYTFAVKGTGRAPDIVVAGGGPGYLREIPNGDTSPQANDGTFLGEAALVGELQVRGFRIRNEGNRRLRLLDATITGSEASDFRVLDYQNTSVQKDDYFDIRIDFNPSANGTRNASVRIVSDDPFKPIYTFAISGTGVTAPVSPSLSIAGAGNTIPNGESNPSSRTGTDFGTLMLGAAPLTRTFQITNSNSETLTLFGVTSSNPAFEITRVTGYTLGFLGRVDFDVTFTPLSGGPALGTIMVLNDDPQNASYTFAVGATTVGDPTPPTIEGLDLDADNGGGEITILGAPGTSLRLASSTTLEDGSWGVVPGYEAIGLTGLPQILSLTGLVDPETTPRIFFRLEEN